MFSKSLTSDVAPIKLSKSNLSSSAVPAPVPSGEMIGDLESPVHARWVLRLLWISIASLIIWSAFAKIDQVTRAPAQLIMAARTQLIQSADGGVITSLHVKEGDSVKTGQLLVTLQKDRAEAAVSDTSSKIAALKITLTRLQAEASRKPLKFKSDLLPYKDYIRNQTDLYNNRQTALNEDIESLRSMLKLATSELNINKKLEQTGDVSQTEILRLERSIADLRAQISNRKNKYLQDVQAEMTKAQEDLSTQLEQLKDRTQILEHTELTAPMDGVVNNIKINTLGGVVRGGETVMELLPAGDFMIVEAKINTADIAFITVGQQASVKIDAYDSSIFGAMQGIVKYISPDVLTEETRTGPLLYYRVRIEITGTEFKGARAHDIQLRPGMTATVDIKAMERTVLSYLTKPLLKAFSQGLSER